MIQTISDGKQVRSSIPLKQDVLILGGGVSGITIAMVQYVMFQRYGFRNLLAIRNCLNHFTTCLTKEGNRPYLNECYEELIKYW